MQNLGTARNRRKHHGIPAGDLAKVGLVKQRHEEATPDSEVHRWVSLENTWVDGDQN